MERWYSLPDGDSKRRLTVLLCISLLVPNGKFKNYNQVFCFQLVDMLPNSDKINLFTVPYLFYSMDSNCFASTSQKIRSTNSIFISKFKIGT